MALPEHLAELDRRYRARFEDAVEQLRRSFEERLRAASASFSAALAEVRAETPERIFEDAELAPLEETPRREGERVASAALHDAALAFDGAATQGAVLEALLAGALRFAPRAGVLITAAAGARGWGGAGFGAELDPFAGREAAWRGAALEKFAAGRGAQHALGADAEQLAEQLGLPAAAEAVLVPLVLRDRVAAALYADRRAGEPELPIAALQLLALGAAQRIELQPLATRAATPTLRSADDEAAPALPLWDPDELAAAAPGAEAVAVAAVPPAVSEDWIEEEAAGAVFELEPAAAEPAAVPDLEPELAAPADWIRPEPSRLPEPPTLEIESFGKSGIEELFEAAPESAPEPPAPVAEAPREAPPIAWRVEPAVEPETAPEPPPAPPQAVLPETEPRWTGPEVVSWAAPPPPEPKPEPAPWASRDTVSWAVPPPVVAPAAPPPPAAPEPEWQLEEPAPPAVIAPPETSTSPFPLPEVTTPIPMATVLGALTPPAGAPAADLAGPAADLAEDATLLVTRRPELAPPPPPVATSAVTEDATVLVTRRPEPAAEPPEDSTQPGGTAAPAAAEEDTHDRTATRLGRTTEVAPPADLQGPGLAFTLSRTQRATGEGALHDEARRLARLLVSEIKLYNEEQVDEGRRHRDLYLRLKEDIDRSRQIYDERVHDSVRGTTDYFQQELIRSLAGGDPRALGL